VHEVINSVPPSFDAAHQPSTDVNTRYVMAATAANFVPATFPLGRPEELGRN